VGGKKKEEVERESKVHKVGLKPSGKGSGLQKGGRRRPGEGNKGKKTHIGFKREERRTRVGFWERENRRFQLRPKGKK